MITIPDALRRPAEVERDELRRRLAEIEEREAACCQEDVPFDEYIRALGEQLARARAEIESKNRLIEQMREALDATDEYWLDKSAQSKLHNTPIVVKVREAQAALLAAERGE